MTPTDYLTTHLEGTIALVIGASRGIGAEIACSCAAAGNMAGTPALQAPTEEVAA